MTNEELYLQYLSGDTEAFEQLYLQMQGFIASVAKDAAQNFGCTDKETLDELCAEGALELCERLSTGAYDEDRGKLTTYLHPFLRGKMYRYLEANLGAAVLPKDEIQRVKQAQRLHKEEMRPLDEVAQTLGVSAEKAAQLIGCKTNALPVSALSDTDPDDDPLAWLLLDQHALTPEQAVYRQVCTEELEQLFRTLSAKDRAILGHTYGVFGYSCISLNLFWKPDSISFTRSFAGCTSVMSANLRRRFHRLFRFFIFIRSAAPSHAAAATPAAAAAAESRPAGSD